MKIYRKRIKFIAESQVSFAFCHSKIEPKKMAPHPPCVPWPYLLLPCACCSRWKWGEARRRLQPGHNGPRAIRHRAMLCIFIMPAHGNPLPQNNPWDVPRVPRGCLRVPGYKGARLLPQLKVCASL